MLNHPIARDISLLLIRLVLGVIFIAHGWDKIFGTGITATAQNFVALNVPQAELSAWVTAIVELVGGALLCVGLLAPTAATLLGLEMLSAFYFVHIGNGLFMDNGGFEYVILLCASCTLIVVFGAGRVSLDNLLTRFI